MWFVPLAFVSRMQIVQNKIHESRCITNVGFDAWVSLIDAAYGTVDASILLRRNCPNSVAVSRGKNAASKTARGREGEYWAMGGLGPNNDNGFREAWPSVRLFDVLLSSAQRTSFKWTLVRISTIRWLRLRFSFFFFYLDDPPLGATNHIHPG